MNKSHNQQVGRRWPRALNQDVGGEMGRFSGSSSPLGHCLEAQVSFVAHLSLFKAARRQLWIISDCGLGLAPGTPRGWGDAEGEEPGPLRGAVCSQCRGLPSPRVGAAGLELPSSLQKVLGPGPCRPSTPRCVVQAQQPAPGHLGTAPPPLCVQVTVVSVSRHLLSQCWGGLETDRRPQGGPSADVGGKACRRRVLARTSPGRGPGRRDRGGRLWPVLRPRPQEPLQWTLRDLAGPLPPRLGTTSTLLPPGTTRQSP